MDRQVTLKGLHLLALDTQVDGGQEVHGGMGGREEISARWIAKCSGLAAQLNTGTCLPRFPVLLPQRASTSCSGVGAGLRGRGKNLSIEFRTLCESGAKLLVNVPLAHWISPTKCKLKDKMMKNFTMVTTAH